MKVEALFDKAERAAHSAEILLSDGDVEGACNRAYYAMFNAACGVLETIGMSTGKTHAGVLNKFSQHVVKEGLAEREDGRILKQAEALRNLADYDVESIARGDVETLVRGASVFVSKMRDDVVPAATATGAKP